MKKIIRISLLAQLVLGAATVPTRAAANDSWTREGSYVMGATVPAPWGATCGVGKVCFGYSPAPVTVTVQVFDDHRRRVGGYVAAARYGGWLSLGHSTHDVRFCGTSNPIRVLPDEQLTVFLDGPANASEAPWGAPPGCSDNRRVGGTNVSTRVGASTGRVVVTFTSGWTTQ